MYVYLNREKCMPKTSHNVTHVNRSQSINYVFFEFGLFISLFSPCIFLNFVRMPLLVFLLTLWIIASFLYRGIARDFLCIYFLIRLLGGGVQLGPLGTAATDWPIVACPGWLWWWRIWWNVDWQRKLKYSEKICPSATLSTANTTWPDPGSNPGRRDGKPAANRLSYGAALFTYLHTYSWSWALLEEPPILQLLKNFPAFSKSSVLTTVGNNNFIF
jgi:hypothetical protein